MQFTAAQIATMINGKVDGNAGTTVGSFGKIEEAVPGQLSFLANPKYEEYLYSTGASIVIINETQELRQKVNATLIRVADAYSAFAALLAKYQEILAQQLTGIQEPSYISKTAKLGEKIFIGAFAYIGDNVRLGNNVKIYPQVFLGDSVSVDDNSILF